jgi:hypothetical protein
MGYNMQDINVSKFQGHELEDILLPILGSNMDLHTCKWIMSAVRATNATATPPTSVFLVQYDAPPAVEIQIVDGGASQFINANRHEFHDYEEFPVHARYTLTGVLATVHRTGTTKEVYTTVDGKKVSTTLTKILHAPDFVSFAPHGISRLFSHGRAQDAGATFTYAQDCTMTLHA